MVVCFSGYLWRKTDLLVNSLSAYLGTTWFPLLLKDGFTECNIFSWKCFSLQAFGYIILLPMTSRISAKKSAVCLIGFPLCTTLHHKILSLTFTFDDLTIPWRKWFLVQAMQQLLHWQTWVQRVRRQTSSSLLPPHRSQWVWEKSSDCPSPGVAGGKEAFGRVS